LTLPEIYLTLDEMERTHIKPFAASIENGIPMIMAAHLHCKCFEDKKIPTSLSKNAISYLRNNLGFNGVIISDDMVMKGVSDFGEVEACVMGIKAGLNMFIYRNSNRKTIQVIEDILKIAQNDYELQEKIDFSYNKIIELKKRFLNFEKAV
jgi:beta-N-acetylhexosaminidase